MDKRTETNGILSYIARRGQSYRALVSAYVYHPSKFGYDRVDGYFKTNQFNVEYGGKTYQLRMVVSS